MNKQSMKSACNILLEGLVGSALAEKWWNGPNKAFNGRAPCEVDIKEVYHYLLRYNCYTT